MDENLQAARASLADLVLSPQELERLTGCTQAAAQVAELKRQGFYRARKNRIGDVVLEREHYVAICHGVGTAAMAARRRGNTPEPELQ